MLMAEVRFLIIYLIVTLFSIAKCQTLCTCREKTDPGSSCFQFTGSPGNGVPCVRAACPTNYVCDETGSLICTTTTEDVTVIIEVQSSPLLCSTELKLHYPVFAFHATPSPAPLNTESAWPGDETLPAGYDETELSSSILQTMITTSESLIATWISVGRSDEAAVLQADVDAMKASTTRTLDLHTVSRLRSDSFVYYSPDRGFFPPIRVPGSGNPFWNGVMALLSSGSRLLDTYPADTADGSWEQLAAIIEDAINYFWAFSHPQSPFFQNETFIGPYVKKLEYVFRHSAETLNTFWAVDKPFLAYLLIRKSLPNLLPSSFVKKWEAKLQQVTHLVMKEHRNVFSNPASTGGVINLDAPSISALYYAGLVFNNNTYIQVAREGLDWVMYNTYADGAIKYNPKALSVSYYHTSTFNQLIRLWLVSGDAKVMEAMRKTFNYYPQETDFGATTRAFEWQPKIDDGIFGESHLPTRYRMGMVLGNGAAFDRSYLSFRYREYKWDDIMVYRRDWVEEPYPDNFVIYNRNFIGPHLRSPTFVSYGSTQSWNTMTGKSFFASCVVPQSKVGSQGIAVTPTFDPVTKVPLYFQQTTEKSQYTVTSTAGAVTGWAKIPASHNRGYWSILDPNSPWITQQEWIFSNQHMVGLLTLKLLRDANATSVMGFVKTNGEYYWRTPQLATPEAVKVANLWYRVNNELDIKFHGLDFANIYTKPGYIRLEDKLTNDTVTYRAGLSKTFLVEFRPTGQGGASVSRFLNMVGGLYGFEMATPDGKYYQLVHNPTDISVVYQVTSNLRGSTTRVKAWKNGAQNRPSFLEAKGTPDTDSRGRQATWGSADQNPQAENLGEIIREIPPHAHLFIESV